MADNTTESSNLPKIYLTKIIGGKVFSSTLEKSDPGASVLKDSGYSLIPDGESLGRVKNRISIECPDCGCSKEKFEETGRFGCPGCYAAFGPFLPGLLRKMHKGERHVGKVPSGLLTDELMRERIDLLSSELNQAIKTEDFEEAARLRDEIRLLKESLPVSGES
ncbi:MAG: UvrB/UvrC motif-containing protein [Verrucomicrobiota bacterium]